MQYTNDFWSPALEIKAQGLKCGLSLTIYLKLLQASGIMYVHTVCAVRLHRGAIKHKTCFH